MRNAAADWAEAKRLPKRVLEQQAEQARGNRAHDQQPSEPGIAVVGFDLAVAQRAAEPAEDPHPVLEEEDEQDRRRGAVCGDEERQEVVVVLVDVPAEEVWCDHTVAKARDREWLRHTLDQAQHDGLEEGDRFHRRRSGLGRLRRTALEPGKDEAGECNDQRRDPVLQVVVARARLMTGKEGRQRSSRLDEIHDRDRQKDETGEDGGKDQLWPLGQGARDRTPVF